MTETLLSLSGVLLFGRKVADLAVVDPNTTIAVQLSARAATDRRLDALNGHLEIDGVKLAAGEKVLVKDQKPRSLNGIYTVAAANTAWTRDAAQPEFGELVRVTEGDENGGLWKRRQTDDASRFRFVRPRPGGRDRLGQNNQLESQLSDASFARIYGFSYEGTYHELPRATLFLIHGDGEPATLSSQIVTTGGGGGNPMRVATQANLGRAPRDPTTTGIAAADFEFADDLRVWSYDKADYTIRMDVTTGMFEQVLLDSFFGGDGGGVSGARVSGARVSGARVSGARVSGARLSGARADGAD